MIPCFGSPEEVFADGSFLEHDITHCFQDIIADVKANVLGIRFLHAFSFATTPLPGHSSWLSPRPV